MSQNDLIIRWKWKSLSHIQLFATPWPIQSMEFSRPNTGVGSLSLLQGIFPTQGPNWGLPHCRRILYQLSQKGNPRILEWVAYPFSSGSSQPRNQTRVSYIAGGFFTTELWGKPPFWSFNVHYKWHNLWTPLLTLWSGSLWSYCQVPIHHASHDWELVPQVITLELSRKTKTASVMTLRCWKTQSPGGKWT